jgi:regulator of protease activity HflC (stomatin/prohibitin superfamily)
MASPAKGIDTGSKGDVKAMVAIVMLIVLLALPIAIIASSLINVEAGYKAVVVDGFGIGKVYGEGWHWKNPLQGVDYVRYNTQVEKFIGSDYSEDNVGNIVVNSRDNVAITIDFQVVFHLDPAMVGQIRVENGDFVETVVVPICRSVPRDVCANFEALDIRGDNRSVVASHIQSNITNRFAQKHIILEEFALQEISLPSEYEAAITAKKVAEQNVITQQYNLEAQQYVAEQTIVNANAAANVTIIDATAKSEAISIIMTQFGVENETEASAVYLRWLYVRALTDPESHIQYVIVPEGGIVPMIDISTEESP